MTYKTLTIFFTLLAATLLISSHSARSIATEIGSDYVTISMNIFLLTVFAGVLALYFYTMYDGQKSEGAGERAEVEKKADTYQTAVGIIDLHDPIIGDEFDAAFLTTLGFRYIEDPDCESYDKKYTRSTILVQREKDGSKFFELCVTNDDLDFIHLRKDVTRRGVLDFVGFMDDYKILSV